MLDCTPLGCRFHHALAKPLPKLLSPVVDFQRREKILHINLSLIGLSVSSINLFGPILSDFVRDWSVYRQRNRSALVYLKKNCSKVQSCTRSRSLFYKLMQFF